MNIIQIERALCSEFSKYVSLLEDAIFNAVFKDLTQISVIIDTLHRARDHSSGTKIVGWPLSHTLLALQESFHSCRLYSASKTPRCFSNFLTIATGYLCAESNSLSIHRGESNCCCWRRLPLRRGHRRYRTR